MTQTGSRAGERSRTRSASFAVTAPPRVLASSATTAPCYRGDIDGGWGAAQSVFMTGVARYDLCGPAHECLRHAHSAMLHRLARVDYTKPQAALLVDLRKLLAMNRQHRIE